MSPSHEPFDELAAGYALGALDGDDLARFEAHLRTGCTACQEALRAHEGTLVDLARDLADLASPPPRIRAAVLADLDATRGVTPLRRPARPVAWLRTAAGMALAASLAAAGVGLWMDGRHRTELARVESEATRLREQLARLESDVAGQREQVARMERETTGLRTELAAERRLAALLADPETRVVQLGGLDPSPQAEARVVWNEKRGGLFVASDLPPAPEGKAYELWAIAGGTPRPAGLFTVDAKGVGSLTVEPIADVAKVDQFAVTLEPAGGVPSPTGAMYLASAAS
jgi:anti-sigma-K factor RskA